MGWVGSGFLATGAAATDDKVEEAALPFDRRRHGTLLGMGACALVVESEDAVRERGMRGIVELLSSETANSAFHGTRLDVNHICDVMERLVSGAERRFGLNRYSMASQMAFISHETFTPARGGSAAAEVFALRKTFGEVATEIVVSNTKGFTGHPMGAGVEDVIAVKILEYGIVPPVPNFKEVDPDLGVLNLSRGGRYPVTYALHLAAGFGSQISMTLIRRIPGGHDRVENKPALQRWLADISGYDSAATEVVKRVLRIVAQGAPSRVPVASMWRYGTGPIVRAIAPGSGAARSIGRCRCPQWRRRRRARGEGRRQAWRGARLPRRLSPRPRPRRLRRLSLLRPHPLHRRRLQRLHQNLQNRLHRRPRPSRSHRPRQSPNLLISQSPISNLPPSILSSPRCSTSSPSRPAIPRTCSTSTWTWKPTWASTPSSRRRPSPPSARPSAFPCKRD
jgi:hypothetical protein